MLKIRKEDPNEEVTCHLQEDGGRVGHLQFHSETMVQACCIFLHLGVAQRELALPPQTYLLVGLTASVSDYTSFVVFMSWSLLVA